MGLFKWSPGRQGDGYSKMLLFQLWHFDCYLLRFEPFTKVPKHTDPAPAGFRHWRWNKTLRGSGTIVWVDENNCLNWQRLAPGYPAILLAASDFEHYYENGARKTYMLSIGWLSKIVLPIDRNKEV